MDSEKINELLNKYWNCETSLEEEAQLKEYFRSSSAPKSLNETAMLFQYFEQERQKKISDVSFNSRSIRKASQPRSQVTTMVYNAMRIAAGIVVLVLAVWLVRLEVRGSSTAESGDTYDDPRMAFEETKKALMMISKSFNTAEEQAKKINLFNEAQKDIHKEQSETEL